MFSLSTNRYHSAKALSLMSKYRIGRTEGPWTNFTPPIRGGVYRSGLRDLDIEIDIDPGTDTDSTDTSIDTCRGSNSCSWNSSSTSIDLVEGQGTSTLPEKIDSSALEVSEARFSSSYPKAPEQISKCRWRQSSERNDVPLTSSDLSFELTSPEDYTSYVLQQEIDNGVRDNPSLDEYTQRDIAMKYRDLHARVKKDGFYDCKYSEYGKEMIRYTILFACFFGCLQTEWYMLSAAFLGLFWVSRISLYRRFS